MREYSAIFPSLNYLAKASKPFVIQVKKRENNLSEVITLPTYLSWGKADKGMQFILIFLQNIASLLCASLRIQKNILQEDH